MKGYKEVEDLKRILRDKSTNNLIVGFILAFATVSFVQDVVGLWNSGPGNYWVGQVTRDIISYLILVVVALYIARLAK